MIILAGNEDEGLRRFQLFFLSVMRTCPLLGETWRVNWQDESKWTDVVSVDFFESVINLSLERPKEGTTFLYFLSACIYFLIRIGNTAENDCSLYVVFRVMATFQFSEPHKFWLEQA